MCKNPVNQSVSLIFQRGLSYRHQFQKPQRGGTIKKVTGLGMIMRYVHSQAALDAVYFFTGSPAETWKQLAEPLGSTDCWLNNCGIEITIGMG